MSATPYLADANVRAPGYFVLRADALCRHCGRSTALLALSVPPGHETLELPEDAEGAGMWQHADAHALLFFVQKLPDGVRRRLRELSQSFRPGHGAATLNSYWANHCEHCRAPIGDRELHCEPEGAFTPASEQAAAALRLVPIPESFEALTAGYSPEPEFFSCIRRIGGSWPTIS
ncbi:MAG TPA: hypothetical protein VN692_19980 [Steroidobacteraceae bacterium]|nr:hypothetical protein [Steroidobacteraceae bacterium]